MNTVNKIFFLLIIISSQKIYSQTDKWTYMYDWGGENNNNYSEYYDFESLTYGDWYIEIWMKSIYNNYWETEVNEGSGIKKKVDYSISKKRIYCGKKKIIELRQIIYFQSGGFRTFLPTLSADGDYYFDKNEFDVIPGTNLEKEYLFFCFK